MSEKDEEHLSRLSTDWTGLRNANGASGAAGSPRTAQERFILRYGPAVRRYLLRLTRDIEAVDELFQEFALVLVEGKFRNTNPERGRFRDYVKAVLRHLVANYYTKRKRGPQTDGAALDALAAPEPPGDRLDEVRRVNLLARTWAALAAANRLSYEVFRFRVDNPDLSSQDVAAQLSTRLGRPITAEAVRQTVHRARKLFESLLTEEVTRSLESPTPAAVAERLAELGLLEYCRPAGEE
jgi:RNA polymerase sigma-70 factor (ECF subfamily)